MLKFLLIIAIFVCTPIAQGFDELSQKLQEIEKTYYGYSVTGNPNTRLSNLEKAIYGLTSTKTNSERIELNKYCKFCKKHTAHKETK